MALLSKGAVAAVSGQSEPLVPEALHNIGATEQGNVCHARLLCPLPGHAVPLPGPGHHRPGGCSRDGRAHCPEAGRVAERPRPLPCQGRLLGALPRAGDGGAAR